MGVIALMLAVISIFGEPGMYSSWCMTSLWGVTTATALWALIRSGRLRRPAILLIHCSLAMVLAGAAVTHFCSAEGMLILPRGGQAATSFTDIEGKSQPLPGAVGLKTFEVVYYPGTSTPSDYRATLATQQGEATVSMNHIARIRGYRLVLASYSADNSSVTLSVRHDPVGTPLTYCGYLLFIAGAACYCFSRGSTFRRALATLRSPVLALLLLLPALGARAADPLPTLPDSALEKLMRLPVFYNGRVTPFATVARDFASDVTGSSSWQGYDAARITAGFLFYFPQWREAPLMKVPRGKMASLLGIEGKRASYDQYFRAVTQGRIDPDSAAMYPHSDEARALLPYEAVNAMVSGAMLRFFPYTDSLGVTRWYAPSSDMPADMPADLWLFIRKSPGLLNEYLLSGNIDDAVEVIDAIGKYQRKVCGQALPSETDIDAELLYMRLSGALPVAAGAVAVIVATLLLRGIGRRRSARFTALAGVSALLAWLIWLSALRWSITGHLPLAGAFETMTFMALCCAAVGVWSALRQHSLLIPLLSLSGSTVALFVAAMSGNAGSITPLMPVLSSPLLGLHVAAVTGAYALFLLMALCGAITLLARRRSGARMAALMQLMLYPALMLLGIGIFIGAVWADMSWGRYWGWDPKEVWALITFIIYSFAAHPRLLPRLGQPKALAWFSITALGSVAVTYFGVNLLLGGMHAYA